mgnify:CR=1 FL=1
MGFFRKVKAIKTVGTDHLIETSKHIQLYGRMMFEAYTQLEGVTLAQEMVHAYTRELFTFALRIIKADGVVSHEEVEILKVLFGGHYSTKEINKLINEIGEEAWEEDAEIIPPVAAGLINLAVVTEGMDPFSIPALYMQIASSIAAADGSIDEIEAIAAYEYVNMLVEYAQSLIDERLGEPA